MRICPVCGKLNPEASRNCDVCGAPLTSATLAPESAQAGADVAVGSMSGPMCPVCRRANRSGSVFCAYCGYRLSGEKGMPPSYALPKAGTHGHGQVQAQASIAPPTLPIPAEVSGNLPSGVLLKRRYRILRKIAQGGMGAVYESADVRDPSGIRWAVKEMSPAALPVSERTQAVSDFRREAQILANLHHQNLPLVTETFEEMGKHFLVMEFIAGRTLLNVLDTTVGYLPEERIMVWMRQVFEVLHYLHSQNPPIIYRDVKPANIMLVESTERIKLIDFGIARFHRSGKAQDTEAFGTAGYAPPEQYGKGQTDQRSDVYALGATLHHLVTKQDPSLNPFNWAPASRLNPNVSPGLENALIIATSLDPARRFGSIDEFAQALGVFVPDAERPQPQVQAQPQPSPITFDDPSSAFPGFPAFSAAPRTRTTQSKKKQQQTLADTLAALDTAATKIERQAQPAQLSKPAAKETKAAPMPVSQPKRTPASTAAPVISTAASASLPAIQGTATATSVEPVERTTPTHTGMVAEPTTTVTMPPPPPPAPVTAVSSRPKKAERKEEKKQEPTTPAQLMVSEPILDLGEARWNSRPARKVSLNSPGGALRGMIVATQPWIAYNPQQFQGNAITLEVKVKRRQLRFGRVELQVPNLFAIIWARTRRLLPFIGCWFWLLLLVASSLRGTLLEGLAAVAGALFLFEGLMWLWAQHVRLLVPMEKVNTGRIMVKSSGGDQQIEVRVLARPSWLQTTGGWAVALLLFATELALATWLVLTLAGIKIPLPSL